jgi:hypothetical protein
VSPLLHKSIAMHILGTHISTERSSIFHSVQNCILSQDIFPLIQFSRESWCPHGGDSEDSGHLGCGAVSFGE